MPGPATKRGFRAPAIAEKSRDPGGPQGDCDALPDTDFAAMRRQTFAAAPVRAIRYSANVRGGLRSDPPL